MKDRGELSMWIEIILGIGDCVHFGFVILHKELQDFKLEISVFFEVLFGPIFQGGWV